MSSQPPSPGREQRARDAEFRAAEGKKAAAEAEKFIVDRDANTARLKALRLERDRQIAAEAPPPKAAKATKAAAVKTPATKASATKTPATRTRKAPAK